MGHRLSQRIAGRPFCNAQLKSRFLHTTSEVGVAGALDHIPIAVQSVNGVHAASVDTVGGAAAHSAIAQQSVTAAHTTVEVAVARADAHVVPRVQLTGSAVHTRPLLVVDATA